MEDFVVLIIPGWIHPQNSNARFRQVCTGGIHEGGASVYVGHKFFGSNQICTGSILEVKPLAILATEFMFGENAFDRQHPRGEVSG